MKTETSNSSNCREKSTIPEPSRWTPRPWGPPLRPRKTWTPRHCPCLRTQVRRHPHPTTLLVQALPKIGMPQIIHPRQKAGCTNGQITSKVKTCDWRPIKWTWCDSWSKNFEQKIKCLCLDLAIHLKVFLTVKFWPFWMVSMNKGIFWFPYKRQISSFVKTGYI